MATIEEEAERLSVFVNNILEMTKLDAGVLDIRRDCIDAVEAVRAAAVRAKKTLAGRKIELASARALPPVRGDAALLEQVVFNLLDNAHKYTPTGSSTRVSVIGNNNAVDISVTDEGPGIPPGDLTRVFDTFYRVSSGDGRAPGTGLGLAICAGIVKAMGGTIKAESPVAAGRGTRVTVWLPAVSLPDGART